MGRAAHASHGVPAGTPSGVRAKPISRTLIASRLVEAMQATGTSGCALATRLGVDEAIVRGLRDGSRPLSVERLVEAGRVGAAVLRAAAEEAHPVARRGASPERHVLSVVRVAGQLAGAVESAEGDAARILGRALELRDAADALIADLGGA